MTSVLRVVSLMTLFVVAAACSTGSSKTTPTPVTPATSTPPPTNAATATAVPQPRPWGEFVVEPVGAPNDPVSPAPQFGETAIASGHLTGATAPRDAAAKVPRFVDIPVETQASLAAKGLAVVFAEATFDPVTGSFLSGLLYARSEQPTAMFQLVAYTPVRPPQVTDFGASGVTVMTLDYAVNGNPTITVFPHPISAPPTNSRTVDWSQDGAVYFLQTTGPFTDDKVLAIARAISADEAARQ